MPGFELLYAGMVQISATTRWRYIVECQDVESGSIYAVVGSADTREECESHVSHEAERQQDLDRHVVNVEACELCRECDGDGVSLSTGMQCAACNGHEGPFTRIRFSSKPKRFLYPSRSRAA
jgi:ferredoxin